ncbi:hypothetical protein Q8A67_009878 [Cirrhinus molitorella]|uniref:Uncharacterized protein n=1 Tax=Cirrhinus molitorella TaxID=172907 RepID=A0AA88PNT1_9TELE|nr:hypothetical protein Q8A67_009878 [Cirrhinus molitorella]
MSVKRACEIVYVPVNSNVPIHLYQESTLLRKRNFEVPTAHGHHLLLPKQRLIQRRQAWSFKDNNGVSRLKHQGSQDIGLAE